METIGMPYLRNGHAFALALLATGGGAGFATHARAATDDDSAGRIENLNRQLHDLATQVEDLKRSQNAQYADIRKAREGDVKLSLKGGRPAFETADGNFSAELRTLVQFDTAYYGQSHAPAGIDFSSGNNFRRARFGVDGTLFRDWSYEFIYDFGGSGSETSGISSAFIQYDGLAPFHFRVGAFPPPGSFDDSTSASDLLFLERAQPTDLARSIAGADGRDGISVFAYDTNYFAALSYTGGVVGDSAVFDEQQGLVGRIAYRVWNSADGNLAIGANASYVFKLADTAPGPNAPHSFRLRERPELNVDSGNIRLIDTGALDADNVWQWGVEAAGNWRDFYGQGGYFGFDIDRNDGALGSPSFDGWYIQAGWVLTGEAKPWRPEKGAFGLPKPKNPFTFGEPGIGAWEIAARYSVLNLDWNAGFPGAAVAPGGVRGGEQRIWTVGLNWYPNSAIRFQLDYQHTDVSRLNNAGAGIGARLDQVSLRSQLSL